jgi:hypothetical protein
MGPYETGRFADIPLDDVAAVKTVGDVARIVERVHADLNGPDRDEWENATLDSFLDALSGVLDSGRYGQQPSWADVAEILVRATGYE